MKTIIMLAAMASLAFAAVPAVAQNQQGAKEPGMSGAEDVLRARGNIKGADRIARAKCFSGVGACTPKYAAQRAKARSTARR